jgi:hypothetical protein
MKHLKTFNESYLDYYQEIDHNQYQQMIGLQGVRLGANKEEMTHRDKVEIEDILNRKNCKVEWDRPNISGKHQLVIDWEEPNPTNPNALVDDKWKTPTIKKTMIVNKVKDEWFLVAIHNMSIFKGNNYKCDQLDGLIEFLDGFLPDK